MEIKEVQKRAGIDQNKKLMSAFTQFEQLLSELRKKELPEAIINSINNGIDQINALPTSEKEWRKQILKTQSSILKLIEKELKLVTKNHYRNAWTAIGMAAFGLPIGTAIGTSSGNMGLLGVGLPIGMVIGMAVGSSMDKKACIENKQLDLEIRL